MSVPDPTTVPADADLAADGGNPVQRTAPVRVAPGFGGVPIRDYVTDGVAALLLLLSLGLSWDVVSQATDHVHVILITVLSILSLSTHYLYRVGTFPPEWSARTVTLVRALLNVPYLVMVLVAVVLDLVAVVGESTSLMPGVGGAAALGLAGACLAATPRSAETDAALATALAARLRTVFAGLAGTAVVLQVLALVAAIVNDVFSYLSGSLVAALLFVALGVLVIAAWGPFAIARGDDAWRPVIVATGATMLVWVLLFSRHYVVSTGAATLGFVVLAAAAPLAVAPVAWRHGADRRSYGTSVAGNALLYLLVIAVQVVATSIALLIDADSLFIPTGTLVTLMILALISGVVAVIGRNALRGPTTLPVLVTLGVILVVGIVVIVVEGASDSFDVAWTDGLVAFGLPAAAAWALAFPARNTTIGAALRSGMASSVPAPATEPVSPPAAPQE